MPFTHDTAAALQAAVVIANSGVDPDTLETVEDLDAIFSDFEYTGRHDRDRAELEAVRAVRPALYELLTADRDAAVGIVNTMLAEAGAVPQLVRHGQWDWHLHAVGPDRDLATRIVVETAMAMIDVIRADEMS
ncbi:MAG TPA: ABATE domain-containing protein, partial [Nocardioides sp.]|nr:ABATE domain-containing protein [Nocardioides sp.]